MPNKEEHIFKCIGGKWLGISAGDSGLILSDYLDTLGILIDECTQFARIIYNEYTRIYYRVYGGKITITIHYV